MSSDTIYVLVDEDPYTQTRTVREGVGYFSDPKAAAAAAKQLNEVAWLDYQETDRRVCAEWNRDMAARNAGGLLERLGFMKPRTGPVMEPQTLTLERFLDVYAMTVVAVHAIDPEEGQ